MTRAVKKVFNEDAFEEVLVRKRMLYVGAVLRIDKNILSKQGIAPADGGCYFYVACGNANKLFILPIETEVVSQKYKENPHNLLDVFGSGGIDCFQLTYQSMPYPLDPDCAEILFHVKDLELLDNKILLSIISNGIINPSNMTENTHRLQHARFSELSKNSSSNADEDARKFLLKCLHEWRFYKYTS